MMNNDCLKQELQWTDEQRHAALHELTDRFHIHLTEQDVFHAAALFFVLLKEGVFIDKAAIVQRMQRERANAAARDHDAERSGA